MRAQEIARGSAFVRSGRAVVAAGLFTLASAGSAGTQTASTATDVAQLRAEIAALKEELAGLRAEVRELRDPTGRGEPDLVVGGVAIHPTTPTAARVEVLEAQVAELAQAKVGTRSRLPVEVHGTLLSNTFLNSSEANWLENPNLVAVVTPAGVRSGSFSSTMRQSRLGLDLGGLAIGGMQVSGSLIADFFGGVPGFPTGTVMGLPRLIYAFARLDGQRMALQIGQDEVMFAPRDPTSLAALSFPLFFRSGNLYLRAPQARVERTFGESVRLMGGIVAPIAGDANPDLYQFAPPPGAGERSRRPAFQGHLGYRAADDAARRLIEIGASGHYGQERTAAGLHDSRGVAFDFNLQSGPFGAAGEIYRGENLDAFGGAVSQVGTSAGGFVEGRVQVAPRTALHGGLGLDRVDAADVPRLVRRRNRGAFGSVIHRFTPEVAASVEYRWLETAFSRGDARANHHVNWVFSYGF
jgi:hypothetical protein